MTNGQFWKVQPYAISIPVWYIQMQIPYLNTLITFDQAIFYQMYKIDINKSQTCKQRDSNSDSDI